MSKLRQDGLRRRCVESVMRRVSTCSQSLVNLLVTQHCATLPNGTNKSRKDGAECPTEMGGDGGERAVNVNTSLKADVVISLATFTFFPSSYKCFVKLR